MPPKKKKIEKNPGEVLNVADEDLEPGDIPNLDDESDADAGDQLEVDDSQNVESASEDSELVLEEMATTDSPSAIVRPKVLAGICESCGVPIHGQWVLAIDGRGSKQWRAVEPKDDASKIVSCKHYQNVDIVCGYCRNPEMARQRTIYVYSLPSKPNVLITCCEDWRCRDKHRKRFTEQAIPSTANLALN